MPKCDTAAAVSCLRDGSADLYSSQKRGESSAELLHHIASVELTVSNSVKQCPPGRGLDFQPRIVRGIGGREGALGHARFVVCHLQHLTLFPSGLSSTTPYTVPILHGTRGGKPSNDT